MQQKLRGEQGSEVDRLIFSVQPEGTKVSSVLDRLWALVRFEAHCPAVIAVVLCSLALFLPAKMSSQAAAPSTSKTAGKHLTDAKMAEMGSEKLAHYVFENHGCKNCHTMGASGKLGLTERGKQVGKGFEGCISLLTSMSVIAKINENDRSPEEKRKILRFKEFGCTTCHQITAGNLRLTAYGAKLKSFHMACTDVEKVLAQQR